MTVREETDPPLRHYDPQNCDVEDADNTIWPPHWRQPSIRLDASSWQPCDFKSAIDALKRSANDFEELALRYTILSREKKESEYNYKADLQKLAEECNTWRDIAQQLLVKLQDNVVNVAEKLRAHEEQSLEAIRRAEDAESRYRKLQDIIWTCHTQILGT